MADFPNVIDLMFGRIDRNTDTQYRDRALQQNQNQFTSQLDADRERTRIAHEQFMKNLGLQTDQFNNQKTQQGFANNLTVNEAIAKGVFKPIATPQQGVMPGNMFMRNPGAISSVDNGDPTMGPGFDFNGQRLQPVNQFKQLLDQRAATQTQDTKFTNQAKADKINALIKVGVPPAIAVFQTEDPSTAAHMFSSPQNMIAALKMIGSTNPGADAVAKTVAEYMAGYQGAVAEAGETASEKSYRAGMTNQANAHAELFRSQQVEAAAKIVGVNTMNRYRAELNSTMDSTDPRFVGEIARRIANDSTLTPEQKYAANNALNNESTIRTQLQNPLMNMFNQHNQAGKNPQTPTYPAVPQATPTVTSQGDTSRPSGAMPAVVNNKPAAVTAPVGALRYTQPDQAPMPELVNGMVPIKRSDGSVDGYVTPERWQEMNQPSTGFSGMGLSNPLTGFSKMMLEYQQRNSARRKQEYNQNNQGFGYRPPNY